MSVERSVESYQRHKNLKLAAAELGVPWQTVYVHLRKAGVPVTGDKARYGSETDLLAAKAEHLFADLVPGAVDQNREEWQPKVDFVIGSVTADVKASRLNRANKNFPSRRWMFSVKKQELLADFFVCAAFDVAGEAVVKWLVIPAEIARNYQTINLPENGGKWHDYEVPAGEIGQFFDAIK